MVSLGFKLPTPQLTIGRIIVVLMMWDYGYLKMCQNKPKNKGIFLSTLLKPSNIKGFQGWRLGDIGRVNKFTPLF